VSTNVEPHEAEAIRDALDGGSSAPVGEVLDRDFHNPRRLGPEDFAEFTRQFQLVLPDMETALADLLDSTCPLELGGFGELNSLNLFADAEGPFAAIVFEVLGQPAWVVWDNSAAIRGIETILGSTGEKTESRRLTSVEVGVLESILSVIADGTLRSLNLEGSKLRVAQTIEGLGSWLDASGEADPHRLHIELPFEGPGEASVFHVYIPAPTGPNQNAGQKAGAVALPEHLGCVDLEVSVTLGSSDIMLNDLLELEVGDVIPLDTRIGEFASLNVEGRCHALGTLGRKHKQVAIRIERLATDPT